MKNHLALLLFAILSLSACAKVPAGHVGVKVYLLGGDKGVDHEELGVGRYWIGINEELYLFPTFKQNYTWTKDAVKGSPEDESITFQTVEGLSVNADVGITYHVDPEQVSLLFKSYRRGIEEITDTFLRNQVRDAFVMVASNMPVENVYGRGKTDLMEQVTKLVVSNTKDVGIIIEDIYLVGDLRLPEQVVNALNLKIEATQRAQQRENELREEEAASKKIVAKARGEAEAILTQAESQAKANIILSRSITAELVEYEKVKKWDGKLPEISGANGLMLNLNQSK